MSLTWTIIYRNKLAQYFGKDRENKVYNDNFIKYGSLNFSTDFALLQVTNGMNDVQLKKFIVDRAKHWDYMMPEDREYMATAFIQTISELRGGAPATSSSTSSSSGSSGVTSAQFQELVTRLGAMETKIQKLETENASLKRDIGQLERLVTSQRELMSQASSDWNRQIQALDQQVYTLKRNPVVDPAQIDPDMLIEVLCLIARYKS